MGSIGKYILVDDVPVLCEDMVEWGKFMGSSSRIIKQETLNGKRISTVFLGLDHSFNLSGATTPILYETMIFSGGDVGHMFGRCATLDQAIDMHKEAREFCAIKIGIIKIPPAD